MPGIFDKSNPDGVYPQLAKLEDALGLPKDFCEALRNEDDWSLIIKLHALLEAQLTTLIVEKIGKDNLKTIFSEIEMSREGIGKVAFAKALGVLVEEERRFIRKLSELRNDLVHGIANVTFNLKRHVDSLDGNQKAAFVRAFSLTSEKDGEFPRMRQYLLEHPKSALWQTGVMLVAILEMQTDIARSQRLRESTLLEIGESHIGASKTALQRLFEEAQATDQAPEEE